MSQSGLNGRQHWKLRSSWIKKIFKRNRSPCHESTSDFFIKKNIPWHNSGEPLDFSFFIVIVFQRMREKLNNGSLKDSPSFTTCRRVHIPWMMIYPGITIYQWSAYLPISIQMLENFYFILTTPHTYFIWRS